MKFKKNKSLTSFENQLPQNRGMKAGHSKKLGGGAFSWLAQAQFEQTNCNYNTAAEGHAVSDNIVRGSTASQPNNALTVFPAVQMCWAHTPVTHV